MREWETLGADGRIARCSDVRIQIMSPMKLTSHSPAHNHPVTWRRIYHCSTSSIVRLFSDPLEAPVALAERAAVVLLQPLRHAAVVEGVVALAPDDNAVILFAARRLRLAAVARVHNLRSTDGARVALDVPPPHSHGVPLL